MEKGFFHLMTSEKVRKILEEFSSLGFEEVELPSALERTAAFDIFSPEDLPPFARSTMDGYAVRARDVFGASETEPALLSVVGEIRMGQGPASLELGTGEAVKIWTGGILPKGGDAVVMVEYTRSLDPKLIEIYRAVAPSENVILRGQDCEKGALCISAGTRLRPQELGLLAGLGITRVRVVKRPCVAIISTGDEVVSEKETPPCGKIRDINSTTLEALVKKDGGVPKRLGIVPDSFEAILDACQRALDEGADVVLISGGSSVGARDYTLKVFEELTGSPPIVHGVAIRPGKPTIISRYGDKALFGLPGHVASCMVVYLLFVRHLLNIYQGLHPETGLKSLKVRCGQMFPSVTGREDYVRVTLKDSGEGIPEAFPVFGKSGLISTLVKAHGLLKIPRDSEGFHQGEEAEVLLL